MSTLFENKSSITDDLKVLAKFIQMDPASPEAKLITDYSNNQNGVRSRDFKSNHQIQIRLQNEVKAHYSGTYFYEIKRGEVAGTGERISNEEAGQYLMAFDLGEPWATHRKYEIFEDRHGSLFGRPEVTADRIVMLQVIAEAIESKLQQLTRQLVAKHAITKFMMMYPVKQYFADDEKFTKILESPSKYMRGSALRAKFKKCIEEFLDEMIVDINMESEGWDDDFDYRDKLRDQQWTKALVGELVKDYKKQIGKKRSKKFAEA